LEVSSVGSSQVATSADVARNTRAVASHRSTRRVSSGPIGALSRNRNRCLLAKKAKRLKPWCLGLWILVWAAACGQVEVRALAKGQFPVATRPQPSPNHFR